MTESADAARLTPCILIPMPEDRELNDFSNLEVQDRMREAYTFLTQNHENLPPYNEVKWTWRKATEEELADVMKTNPHHREVLINAWMAEGSYDQKQ
jgi:hypothetical protein